VHQFIESMVPDWQSITPQPDVVLVRDMDGFGGQQIKEEKYEIFIHDEAIPYVTPYRLLDPVDVDDAGEYQLMLQHEVVCGGIKLFYQQDTPLLGPGSVLTLDPPPLVVIYQ